MEDKHFFLIILGVLLVILLAASALSSRKNAGMTIKVAILGKTKANLNFTEPVTIVLLMFAIGMLSFIFWDQLVELVEILKPKLLQLFKQ